MRFSEYIKDKILICLLHFLCMILLMGFFYITGYNRNAAALILIFWWIILGIWSVTGYYRRKKYFDRAEHILENVIRDICLENCCQLHHIWKIGSTGS